MSVRDQKPDPKEVTAMPDSDSRLTRPGGTVLRRRSLAGDVVPGSSEALPFFATIRPPR